MGDSGVEANLNQIDAATLKAWLHDGDEIALLDAREEVPFDKRHLLMASCLPLSRLECLIDGLVPRRSVRVVWCDDGEGLAERAAKKMSGFGYTNISLLKGGIAAWEAAGYPIYSGIHVPSKAFAEVVEHETETPWVSAEELKAMIDDGADIAIYDTRSYEEYHGNSIPGAISVPGAELIYRFADLTPSPDTTVIVNCGGRTRSIIGAQALINAGVPNKVVSLKNGTQAWHLSGFDVVQGATKRPPEVSSGGLSAALEATGRIAARFNVQTIDKPALDGWRQAAGKRSLYILDVRTSEEYEAGHLADARLAPGGQLVQETDVYLGAWSARVVLVDDNGIRATITASWLQQMGWNDVAIHTIAPDDNDLATGPYVPNVLGSDASSGASISADELEKALSAGTAVVIDLADSKEFARGHVAGAWFAIRSRLPDDLGALPATKTIILTSTDGALAAIAAAELGGSACALAGGTKAWTDSGRPLESGADRMASPPDDIRLKAREQSGSVEAAMNEYLAWEIDLVNQMAADDDHRFKIFTG
jgi:rhodanese-related sulfurtransferase